MAVYRMQCAWQVGSAFPRDRMIINPVFEDHGLGSDPDGLTADLANFLAGWAAWTNELTVTCYRTEGDGPHYPEAQRTENVGNIPESLQPRELALCLSYYSEVNRPRFRGRIYLPLGALFTGSALGARPDNSLQTKLAGLASAFGGLGGVDVDWSVWSDRDQEARPVSHWWVDDEWDVQRRRGLRATGRLEADIGE